MPSLPRHSPPAPVAHQTSRPQLQQQAWMTQAREMPWAMGGVALHLVLGVGLSLVGTGALAMQASHQTPTPHSVSAQSSTPSLPQRIAQDATDAPSSPSGGDSIGEAIQGDSEARRPSLSKGSVYTPIRLKSGRSVEDTLTTKDIPMGQGSFARDYVVTLKADDQVAIDLFSDSFDTVVALMSENGTTLGENDDGPDGGTNSLLFMRITEDGDYVVRVRGFGQAKGGPFKLKLTRLKAAQ